MCVCVCAVDHVQLAKHNVKRTVGLMTDLQRVASTCTQLQQMLTQVLQYVDDYLVSECLSLVLRLPSLSNVVLIFR